jgi:hypothetical protein
VKSPAEDFLVRLWLWWRLSNWSRTAFFVDPVLDEVHERTMDTDLLNLLIKKLLDDDKSHIKLIVMSATLQEWVWLPLHCQTTMQPPSYQFSAWRLQESVRTILHPKVRTSPGRDLRRSSAVPGSLCIPRGAEEK